jgi:hypothetical protein
MLREFSRGTLFVSLISSESNVSFDSCGFVRGWMVASSVLEKRDCLLCGSSREVSSQRDLDDFLGPRVCVVKNLNEALSDVVVEKRPFTRLGFPTGSGRPFREVPPLHANICVT